MEENEIFQCPNPDCRSESFVKNGKVGKEKKQRYKCKDCSRSFFLETKNKVEIHRKAVILYLEGMTFDNIAKNMNVSKDSVQRWISPMKEHLDKLRNNRGCKINKLNKHPIDPLDSDNSYFTIIEQGDETLISFLDTTVVLMLKCQFCIPYIICK